MAEIVGSDGEQSALGLVQPAVIEAPKVGGDFTAITDHARAGINLKRRAAAGVVTLLVRRVAAQLVAIVGTTLLMRILPVEVFGLYAIVAFVVTVGGYFADAGLGAALVRRKEEITERDLAVVFTVQFTLLGVATLAIFLIAPWVQQQYKLPGYASGLLSVLGLTLFISSFKTIPAIIMERRLDYQKLSVSDMVELITFQTLAVVLAVVGMGAWSFVLAALCQAVTGSLVLFLLCPWRPTLTFNFKGSGDLLRFGVFFQSRTLINVVKDNITPTLIALIGGPLAVGYVGFAQKLSSYPLMIEEATSRVAFPAYSRIQDDLTRLRLAIENTLKLVNVVLLPLSGLLLVLAEPLTRQLLGGEKWLPALPAFYLFSIANLTAGTSNVLVTSLYALGRPGVVLKLSLIWAVGTWLLALPLVLWLGWIGLPVATTLLAVTVVLPVREVRKIVPINILRSVLKPGFAALLATGTVWALGTILNTTLPGLVLNGLLGVAVYTACLLIVDRAWLINELISSLPIGLSTKLLKSRFSSLLAVDSNRD